MAATFLDYLDHLRRKPEGTRRRITLGAAIIITLLVLGLWLLNLHFTAAPVGSVVSTEHSRSAGSVTERIRSGWQILIEKL